jgi:hypothetical protein
VTGAQCQAQTDCCIDLRCVFDAGVGSCQPTCGTERAPCDPRRGNADCCLDDGFTCVGWGADGGAPFACNDMAAVPPDGGCVAACTDGGPPQCQLGSPCAPNFVGGNDNCVPAGLVCSEQSETCAAPADGAYCAEGGAACRDGPDKDKYAQYLRNANVGLECIQPTQIFDPVCVQLCESTKDCANPYFACCDECVPHVCVSNIDACSDFYHPCNAQGSADGRCERFGNQGNLCVQANTDGGGPGSACDELANRENPAFCDFADQCWFGVCVPTCNISGEPGCSGAAQCLGVGGTLGVCLTTCSIWESGGCPTVNGGVAQVCLPYFGFVAGSLAYSTQCVAQQPNPSPVGARCVPPNGIEAVVSFPSPCVAGAICLNEIGSNDWTCQQLCEFGGGASCSPGSTCHPIPVGPGIATRTVGVCSLSTPSDGG